MTPTRGVLWVVEARWPGGHWSWDRTAIFTSRADARVRMALLRRSYGNAEYRVVRYVREDQP